MKKKGIAAVINKRFKKIEKLFGKIIPGFEMEPIHEFRTEMKKLRAFLRLLNVETGSNKLKISKTMKAFYQYAGTIRNLQLQLKNMSVFADDPQYIAPATYIEYLKQIIEKWKADAIEFTGQKNNFNNDKKEVIRQLPRKLRRASVKKFLKDKMTELALLVKNLPDDDTLHSIRKLLKDILYNWVFIKSYDKLLPSDFSDEEKIKLFTELLGLFLDRGIGINLIETYCKDCEENGLSIEEEIKALQEIEERWKKEKQELTQIIYLHPGLLNDPVAGQNR